MKRTLISLILFFVAVPCHGQWRNAYMQAQILAFGVHNDSLFIGVIPEISRDPLVWRLGSLSPNVVWVIADTGIDPTLENVTSITSLGTYIYAGMTRTDNGSLGSYYRSANDGKNWDLIQAAAPAFSNGDYLFGNGFSSAYRSHDYGNTWQAMSCPEVKNYASIGITIFANTGNALWRSTDTGNNWSLISPPFFGTMTVMDSLVFIVGGNGQLAVSTDSGSNWSMVTVDSAGVPETVDCLATNGKNLFAGTTRGVLVSTDVGKSWQVENTGLTYTNVSTIAVFDTLLFIDVTKEGLNLYNNAYYRPISELTGTSAVAAAPPPHDTIEIFPNPTLDQVSILSGGTSILGVSVLNVLGENVLNTSPRPGTDLTLDLSKLPSGTYFLEIETAKGIVLRKVVRE